MERRIAALSFLALTWTGMAQAAAHDPARIAGVVDGLVVHAMETHNAPGAVVEVAGALAELVQGLGDNDAALLFACPGLVPVYLWTITAGALLSVAAFLHTSSPCRARTANGTGGSD